MKARALVISYYWPPAGGPGVQRWLQFVRHLKDFDVEPIVYVPENPHYPFRDEDLQLQVPKDIEILKTPILEPYRWASVFSKSDTDQLSRGVIAGEKKSWLRDLMLFVRGNFFIPDSRVGWVRPSVKYLTRYLSQYPVDVVISTGPPHSMHLIAMELQKRLNVKWLADFRDPWTTIHYHKDLALTASSQKKHKKLEAAVFNAADHLVVTSPRTKKEFSQITQTPITVITNGYSPSGLGDVTVEKSFSLAHIGTLLSGRNPHLLWEILGELAQEHNSFQKDLKLTFAGTISSEVEEDLHKNDLWSCSEVLEYISHPDALVLQRKSQVLLLIEMDRPETRAIIPGKLFEYLAARRPIIAIGPQGSDMGEILEETQAGTFFDYSSRKKLKQEVWNLYREYKSGTLNVPDFPIEKYSRRELTRKMAELILRLKNK